MGEERRITDLTAISAFRSNDYIAVDNASEAQTKKLPATAISNPISAAQTDATRALNLARSTSSFPTGDAYSSSSAYKVGDMVIYNNTLYRCKTACSAASWSVNANNFEATSLASALTDVNNDLSSLSFQEYTKDSPTVHISATGGIYDFYAIRIGKLLKVRATLGYGSAGAVGFTFDDLSFNKQMGGSISNILACDYTASSIIPIRINLTSAITGSHNQSFATGGHSSQAFLVLDTVFLLDAYGV